MCNRHLLIAPCCVGSVLVTLIFCFIDAFFAPIMVILGAFLSYRAIVLINKESNIIVYLHNKNVNMCFCVYLSVAGLVKTIIYDRFKAAARPWRDKI